MLCTSRSRVRGRLGEAGELAGLSRTVSILPLSKVVRLPHDRGVTTSSILQTIVRGPTSHLQPAERRARRHALRYLRLQSGGPQNRPTTLLLYEHPHRLTARCNTRWFRAISRVCATSLDRRLADGRAPESHRLLAARAQLLVTPVERQKLAYLWDDLVTQARKSTGLRVPRVPINRESILANEPDIRAIIGLLVEPTPGHVRGIALLSSLLSDGTGPLYNRRCSADLRGALLDAITLLASSVM
jgi:hypothetical protein